MLQSIDQVPLAAISHGNVLNTDKTWVFSMPMLDLCGELRSSSVNAKFGTELREITTQFSFRIAKWRQFHGFRLERSDGSHCYFELPGTTGENLSTHSSGDALEMISTSYALDSAFGNLIKIYWALVGSAGPSAFLVAPTSKVLSRSSVSRRLLSQGIRLHSISPDLADELLALRNDR